MFTAFCKFNAESYYFLYLLTFLFDLQFSAHLGPFAEQAKIFHYSLCIALGLTVLVNTDKKNVVTFGNCYSLFESLKQFSKT